MNNKTAVVTGATSGIGAAYARLLAAEGYRLLLTGRRQAIVQKLADDLAAQHGVDARVLISEFSNDRDVQKVADAVAAADGLEVLVNNAGYGGVALTFDEMEFRDYEPLLKADLLAPLKLVSAAMPSMLKQGRGVIVNVASVSAYTPMRKRSIYCGSKAFMKLFSESLYMDLRGKGIKVQLLVPRLVRSDFYRGMKAEERERLFRDSQAMSPEEVVDYSWKCLHKDKPICMPGTRARFTYWALSVLPRSVYYRIAERGASA